MISKILFTGGNNKDNTKYSNLYSYIEEFIRFKIAFWKSLYLYGGLEGYLFLLRKANSSDSL